MSSAYCEPEKYGLETIGEIDVGASYEFDIAWVSREKTTGHVWVAFDSGCSCPTPFEDHRFPEMYFRTDDARALRTQLVEWGEKQYGDKPSTESIAALVRKAFP